MDEKTIAQIMRIAEEAQTLEKRVFPDCESPTCLWTPKIYVPTIDASAFSVGFTALKEAATITANSMTTFSDRVYWIKANTHPYDWMRVERIELR